MEGRACEFQPYGVRAYSSKTFRNTYTSTPSMSDAWLPGVFLAWGGTSEHAYALVRIRDGYVIEVDTPHFRFVTNNRRLG